MMTKKMYTLKSVLCSSYTTSRMKNSSESPMSHQVSNAQLKQSSRSTRLASFLCWIICAIALACLLFLTQVTDARNITRKSVLPTLAVIQRDSLSTSLVPTQSIVISIYVLPSLLDSLESALDTTSSISTSTMIKPRIVSGTTNVD